MSESPNRWWWKMQGESEWKEGRGPPPSGTERYPSMPVQPLPAGAAVMPVLHILIPSFIEDTDAVRSEEEKTSHNWGKDNYVRDLKTMSAEVGYNGVVHFCKPTDFQQVIDAIPRGELIFDACDGADIDGIAGPVVAKYLQDQGRDFVGCSYEFQIITTEKNDMKKLFLEKKVPTSQYLFVTRDKPFDQAEVEAKGMKYPLFVKPADSYGSNGIDQESVCHTPEAVAARCAKAFDRSFKMVLVEEFIEGSEFTVLVIGNSRNPTATVDVFPPAQRVFDPQFGKLEQFLSFERVWVEGGTKYQYAAVPDKVASEELMRITRAAYAACEGNGFGRVDIRRRDATNEFFVLEVNATCGIGYESTSGEILKLAGRLPAYLLSRTVELGRYEPVAPGGA